MKKVMKLAAVAIMLSIFTGCLDDEKESYEKKTIFNQKQTLVCTNNETDEEGYETKETMTVTYNNDKVLNIHSETISKTDPEYIDMQIGFTSLFSESFDQVEGLDMSFDKLDESTLKVVTKIDYTIFNPEKFKELLGDAYDDEDDFFEKNNFTIKEFKDEVLDDYDCK